MVAGLLIRLAFHTEDPDGVGGIVKNFLFPDLSLSAGSQVALAARQWDMALDSSTLTTYSDTASLLQRQKVAPIIGWETTVNMLEQWAVLLTVILGPDREHPAVYELTMLIDAS